MYKYMIISLLAVTVLLNGLTDMRQGKRLNRLQQTINIYERHVVPGLINNVNFFRHEQGLEQIDFYEYISDYSLYTQPIKEEK